MATASLSAETRTETGKGVARKLRAAGRVPAVVYGHAREPQALSLTTRELVNVCWMRMTAQRSDPEGWMMIRGPEYYTSSDRRMIREHHLRTWQ